MVALMPPEIAEEASQLRRDMEDRHRRFMQQRTADLAATDREAVQPRLDPALERRISAYKYVLAHGEIADDDGLPEASTQVRGKVARLARPRPGAPVYVMPRDDREPARNRQHLEACVAVAKRHGYRLTLQLHKLVGLP